MTFFSGFGIGASSFFKSWEVLFTKGLWHYLLYPLILRILFWALVLIGMASLKTVIHDYFTDLLTLNSIPDSGHSLSWLKSILNPSASVVAWIASSLIGLVIAWFLSIMDKYIVLIVLSPVLSLASEATDEKLTGKKYPFNFGQLMKDVLRGTVIALRNMFIEYGLFFAGFLLLIIPGLGVLLFAVYEIFLLFVSWYFYGFAMIDYSCERNKMGVRESVRFISKHKGTACGIGFFYWLLFMIPFVGFIFAPITSVIGATIAFNEIKAREAAGNNLKIAESR